MKERRKKTYFLKKDVNDVLTEASRCLAFFLVACAMKRKADEKNQSGGEGGFRGKWGEKIEGGRDLEEMIRRGMGLRNGMMRMWMRRGHRRGNQ